MPSTPVPATNAIPAAVREPLERLPGRGAFFRVGLVTSAPRSSLWMGGNHLLQVNSGAMRDEYRRFYYRDVQALQLRRTRRGLIFDLVFVSALGLLGLCVAFLGATSSRTVAIVLAGAFLVLLLTNLLRGPTVQVSLRTAIGLYPLPSLSRLGPAQRALARIRERVEAAQGGALSDEAVAARLDRAMRERSLQPGAVAVPPPAPGV